MRLPRTAQRRWLGLGLATAAVTALASFGSGVGAAPGEGTILHTGGATAIADQYIVVFKDTAVAKAGVDSQSANLANRFGGTITHTYRSAVRGFAIQMPEAAAKRLAAHPSVDYVEQDHQVSIADTQPNPPSWGLDRIDQRNLPLDNSYTYPNTASNVHIYIIDTGIRISHNTFGGRASHGYDFVDNDPDASDCNGHGTHVAGTTSGNEYGVAKGAQVVGVRVLDCGGSGSFAGVVAGVDWVTDNAQLPAVANMSLGASGTNSTLENAVTNSINSGVQYALAAGNSNANACNFTPARTPAAITVGATESNDSRASYSNFGTCLDIFAPGSSITSAWYTSDTATNTISGTSMASPHAAGVAALILGANPGYTPQQVRDQMVADATTGVVGNPGSGSPNALLYVNNEGGPGNQPPSASFTHSCDDATLTCSFDGSASSDPDGSITGYSWNFGDGSTGSGATVSHTYAADGIYTVTLTVTDDEGATGSTSQDVTVGEPPANQPPNASFTSSCTVFWIFLYCAFDASGSSDPDGSITSYAWDFGDGGTGSGVTTTNLYFGTQSRTVTLTVTDDGGATDTATGNVP